MGEIKQYEPLWGAWYVDSLIGEGSFGKVYKVRREEFGKTYYSAVKIITIPQNEADLRQIRGEGMDDASARSYFHAFVADIIQEIDLMSEFRGNSNIVSFEDHKVIEQSGKIGWDILIRMELLTSLTDHVTEKPLARDEIIKLGVHICRALELCAIKKTIHRDIKPDNIFVSQYGEYKLGDFGIARQIERTAAGLSKKGTYTYMAPEVFKGDEYGSSVDMYSLGIVMYRFLNQNRTPFLPNFPAVIKPSDRDEALQRRMKGEALPPLKGVSSDLNAIILKACAYDRKERFSSPTEMRRALESVIGEKSFEPIAISVQSKDGRERTDSTAGVLDSSATGVRRVEDRTSATERAFTDAPKSVSYPPYREATSLTESVFGNGLPNTDLPRDNEAASRPLRKRYTKLAPIIGAMSLIAVVVIIFVLANRPRDTVVSNSTIPPTSSSNPVVSETAPVTDLGENETTPTPIPMESPVPTTEETEQQEVSKVLLYDLAYFASANGDGGAFQYESSLEDNLGNVRNDCLTGLNSSADLIYKINGKYGYLAGTLFQTMEERNYAGAVLTIYGDGVRLLSEVMHGGIEPIDFSIDIQGVEELRITYESEPGEHWASFRNSAISDLSLYPAEIEPSFSETKKTAVPSNILLKDLNYFTSEYGDVGGLSDVGTQKDNEGNIRYNCLSGRDDPSILLYKIDGKYTRITGTLFMIEGETFPDTGTVLTITGDGETLFSASIYEGYEPIDFDIPITGVIELTINYRSDPDRHWSAFRNSAIADCLLHQ